MINASHAHRWFRCAMLATVAVVSLVDFNRAVAGEPSDGGRFAFSQAYEQGAKIVHFADMPTGQAAARGASLVYSNTLSSTFYTIGAPFISMGDDIRTTAPCGCELSSYSVRVDGGGDGDNTFMALISLWDGCPGTGEEIPGTSEMFLGIPDGVPLDLTVDLSAAPVPMDRNFWVKVVFSTAQAGVFVGSEPDVGFSNDFYYHGSAGCTAGFTGDTYAAFAAEFYCSGTGEATQATNPSPTDGAVDVARDAILSWNNAAARAPDAEGRPPASEPSSDPIDRAITRIAPERAVMGITTDEYAERERALHASLIGVIPDGARANGINVELTADDRETLEDRFPAGRSPMRIGINKAVVPPAGLDRGAMTVADDGSFVWAATVKSVGATAIRVHLANVSLPDGAELYFLSDEGEAHGPYTGRGPNGSGDFWTHSVFSDTGLLLLRHPRPAPNEQVNRNPFEIVEVAHIDHEFRTIAEQRGGSFCGNPTCVVDASCAGGTPVDDARDAVARMVFQIPGQGTFLCSGGLIADTDPGSQSVYFLTANHCISEDVVAQSLECFFFYHSSSCGASCPAPNASFRTLGAVVRAAGTAGDFSLLELDEDPPSGAVFLGWNNSAVATINGTELFRISHPNGGAQTYSEHTVDSSPPVNCGSLPLGQFIYSEDVFGAVVGGSSGAPVVNAAGEAVGQLFGWCGSSFDDPCDSAVFRTVDGALASYWDSVAEFLNPICTERYDVFFGTTNPPTAQVCSDIEVTNCDPGPLGCDETYYWQVDAHFSGTTASGPVWSFSTIGGGADCNSNGVGDECEIADGTAQDCNGNGIPDDCDIGTISEDCNGNGVPDECEADCQPNGTPDDCDLTSGASEDCNGNGIPDECDIAGGSSSDGDGNGIPDECENVPPAIAAAPHDGPKNRYLSFDPNSGTTLVAFQVTLSDARVCWVGAPCLRSDTGGVDPQWVAECVQSAAGDGSDMVRDWSSYTDPATGNPVVHLRGCVILPDETYDIRSMAVGGALTAPLTIGTVPAPTISGSWADIVGDFDAGTGRWGPPDSNTGFKDIAAGVQGFQKAGTAPVTWTDLTPNGDSQSNYIVGFDDIGGIISGFQGTPYPGSVASCAIPAAADACP